MATWIKTDGTVTDVKPANGKRFTLPELQRYVGGYIQLISTHKPIRNMYVNEEGLLKDLPMNRTAQQLANHKWLIADCIRGDVLICEKGEG